MSKLVRRMNVEINFNAKNEETSLNKVIIRTNLLNSSSFEVDLTNLTKKQNLKSLVVNMIIRINQLYYKGRKINPDEWSDYYIRANKCEQIYYPKFYLP